MKALSKKIAARYAPGYDDIRNLEARTRVGLIEGWVSVVLNTLLAALKGWLGLMTGSVALVADAFHSFSDSGTSLVVILSCWIARKPPDREHPFGHGRIDSVASVVIAVLLGVVALELLHASFLRLLHPQAIVVPGWVVLTVALTIGVKELLARFSVELGRLIGSDSLKADAWHHRSDAYSTVLVLFAFFGPRLGAPWLDGVMGIGVGLMVGWVAWEITRQSLGPLLGEHAPDEVYREIGAIASAEEGVLGVHDIIVHRYGMIHVISLHIEVPGDRSPMDLHQIGDRIEDRIADRFPGHAVVHVDPLDFNHPCYERVQALVREAVGDGPDCGTFHDLRLVGDAERFTVLLDITMGDKASSHEMEDCRQRIRRRVQGAFPGTRVKVNVEPPYIRPAG